MKLVHFSIVLAILLLTNILAGQNNVSPIFDQCKGVEPSAINNCNKQEMLHFINQEILLTFGGVKKTNPMNDIVLGFDVKKDGKIQNITLTERTPSMMFVTSAQLNIDVKKIPNFTGNSDLSISYIFTKTQSDSQDLKLVTISPMQVEIFKVVEKMPRFPGCEFDNDYNGCSNKKLDKYIDKNIVYPEEAINNKVEGTVIIEFVVTEEGLVTDAKVKKDIGFGCGQAAIDVIESMNFMPERWISGAQRTRLVNVLITKPIEFKLDKKHKNKD